MNDPFQQLRDKPVAGPAETADPTQKVGQISHLLDSLDAAAAESGLSASNQTSSPHENKLVHARLGIASGLFAALRAKHAPTAAHSIRVALGCSSWAAVLELSEDERDALEVAALLHDIGKIGVPDKLLLKPGRLQPEEMELMARHRAIGVDILASCGVPPHVLDVVRFANAWFDGSLPGQNRRGEELPTAARMLAIVDAYDSMTTDHVYRPAKPRDRALSELFQLGGTQFDSQLVRRFCELFAQDQNLLTEKVARRWLQELPKVTAPLPWRPDRSGDIVENRRDEADTHHLFEEKLIDNMHDGVVFVDGQSQIFLWNTGAERLTGVSGNAACGRLLVPSLLDMCRGSGSLIDDTDCPIAKTITTGVQNRQRLGVIGRNGDRVNIDLHAIPVRNEENAVLGATVLLRDASSETSLEEKCQALHAQVTLDPMTQVANRAEFDRMQALFIEAHQQTGLPCSLIMTDIDHFKNVNDTYGHQAGDEAIIALATLLKSMCRAGDLVARYGGEEFAVLCADCTNAAAVQRAESIRKKLAELTFSFLGNKNITASFGVTELQPGDTSETMLRRADRGLLQAKDQGRNQVVQLGDGMNGEEKKKGWWPFASWRGQALIEVQLVTAVPMEVSVQKLRGFIADHEAKISKTGEDHLRLELSDGGQGQNRRLGDRAQEFSIDLQFQEEHVEKSNSQGFAAGSYVQTKVVVTIRPRRDRDRRRDATTDKARQLLGSLKSYLMAKELNEADIATPEPAAVAAD
jgi:diguanylate cyclase (GGDEF)-like protein/putative nucleotidyltransferase with HDIG domain/PAS domain S-box-containing protein